MKAVLKEVRLEGLPVAAALAVLLPMLQNPEMRITIIERGGDPVLEVSHADPA